jgi:CheY-like chemotaxis protein/HPt (histidine-containing phosphotransfer) domain-containing protein
VVIACVVSDSGIGIAADKLLLIFDNFTQVSSDISGKYGGTGLGLAITKRLIQMQGGEITVDSTPGTGTTFRFHLPYAIPKGSEAEVPFFPQGYEPVKKDYCGKRALVVEDNEINQAVLASSLQHHHLNCHIASNGREAIGLIESGEHFDIIFMDLRMPLMNGFEATAYIRQKLQLQVPIVILTASVLRNERERALQIGASEYMAKPFAMADLARALEQFLPNPDHQPETAPGTAVAEAPAPPPEETAFDISQLLEMGDPESIRQILDIFSEKMPLYFQELQSCLTAGDWKKFLEKAHKIKGSLSFIQIQEIYQLVLTMEAQVHDPESLAAVAPMLERCLILYNRHMPAVHGEVDKQLIAMETNL